jgi:predicted DsbA family dithiol-disulfide isomerase
MFMVPLMKIDVISDTICPWCYIGKRRLAAAIAARPDADFKIHWRPFQLDPSIPKDGVDRKEYIANKFGTSPKAKLMSAAIRDAGEREGIAFRMDLIARTPNTIDSHRLIRWAQGAGVQDQMVDGLFSAYFIEGRDIGDHAVLSEVAGAAGMDPDIVLGLLHSDADLEKTVTEGSMARKIGVEGVPAFLFSGRYLISGAEDAATLGRVIDRVLREKAEEASAQSAAE